MNVEDILSGESKDIEYKVSRPEKSIKYMKSVVAFANGKGGRIIFGIDDATRTVVGIPKDIVFREIDAITNAISDSCEPVIIPDVYPQTIEGKTIIIVEIAVGKQRPYYIKSEGIMDGVYMRVSGTTRPADRTITRELYYEGEGRSFDTAIRQDIKVTDGEIRKLCSSMKDVALANCRDEFQRQSVKDVTKNVLLNWGILAETEDGTIYPTNAYVFLTGGDVFLSKIQCGMFKGTSRAVFLDKRDYEGMLWQQIEDAFQFVLRNIRLGAKIEGVYRKDIYELPPDSVRELIINAVINCSFLQASHVQIAIYDDRLEITSPGGLMPGVTVDRMKQGYSQIRNRALAHAFSYMNLIEGWGTGIPRLLREMEEYGLQEPEFLDMETALRINLYRSQDNISDDLNLPVPDTMKKVPDTDKKVPDTDKKVPDTDKKVPDTDKKVPDTDEKVPDTMKKMPDTDKKVPDTDKKVPDTMKKVPDTDKKVPDTDEKVPDTDKKVPDTMKKMPDTDEDVLDIMQETPHAEMPKSQELIVNYIICNGEINSAIVEVMLNVKQRRARAILNSMVKMGLIAKTGAARGTKYILPDDASNKEHDMTDLD